MRAAVLLVFVCASGVTGTACLLPLIDTLSSSKDESPAETPDAASPPPAPAKADPCSGAVAAWPLDDGTGAVARECTGRFPGKLTGAVSWTTGRGGVGHALAFSGGAVALEDAVALRVGGPPQTPAFSAMAWLSARSPDYARFFLSRSDGRQDAWAFALYPDTAATVSIGMRLVDKAGSPTDLRSDPVALAPWIHAAAVFDGQSTMTFYVDGLSKGKRTFAAAQYAPSVAPLRIGAPVTNNAPFEGTLSDVRIYARALSAEEIKAIASK
ncbi:MAG TPA: LamG domain-containing protein [Labilithrix sp.]|nr:LamG domain-containing protein [Labilithrix sp.]